VIALYVYPGWHAIPERDAAFYPGFTEWDLVYSSPPRFPGHHQPNLPRDGRYDDTDPRAIGPRVSLCAAHGVDALIYGAFWCRGKRVFERALDDGFLGSDPGRTFPFAVMWANRMPRRVLPVRRADRPVIDPSRHVPTDVEDFVDWIALLAERYFSRPNYLRLDGKLYFSIFDSTFFLRELGLPQARAAIAAARAWLAQRGFPELHLAAIEPSCEVIGQLRDAGFDSVTNYVLLPYWKGPFLQDYATVAARRATEWSALAAASGLPYHPSVSPGWDASPRAADFGPKRPDKYPWHPVVTGSHPDLFRQSLERALRFTPRPPIVFVASWNEWSEGHTVEPDTRFGTAWLEAISAARQNTGF
jgi:hypothetical protein